MKRGLTILLTISLIFSMAFLTFAEEEIVEPVIVEAEIEEIVEPSTDIEEPLEDIIATPSEIEEDYEEPIIPEDEIIIDDVNYSDELLEDYEITQVICVGEANEQYNLIVPIELRPGETGQIILEGMWPSNKEVSVIIDNTLTMSNDIDDDTVELQVNFDGLSIIGNNFDPIYETQDISIEEFKVLFGTWKGQIHYDIKIEYLN